MSVKTRTAHSIQAVVSRGRAAGRSPGRGGPSGAATRLARAPALTLAIALALAVAFALPVVASANGETAGKVPEHELYFTRGIYGGELGEMGWGPRWATDYPKADQQFLVALHRLTVVDAPDSEHAISLSDPALRDFPFLYVLEVGSLNLGPAEAEALRGYLLAGGFMIVDDAWGSRAWQHFKEQMRLVFPDRPIVDLPLDHPIFHSFYDIDEIIQVPNVYQAGTDRTWEADGRVPYVRGIFDDQGRLMVAINWNTDLGDAWEWADLARYPLRYSNYALKMGINFIIYAMSY